MIISQFPEKGAVAAFFGKTLEYLKDDFFPPQANSEKHFLGKPRVLLKTILLFWNTMPSKHICYSENKVQITGIVDYNFRIKQVI